jgi:hypothetical protein
VLVLFAAPFRYRLLALASFPWFHGLCNYYMQGCRAVGEFGLPAYSCLTWWAVQVSVSSLQQECRDLVQHAAAYAVAAVGPGSGMRMAAVLSAAMSVWVPALLRLAVARHVSRALFVPMRFWLAVWAGNLCDSCQTSMSSKLNCASFPEDVHTGCLHKAATHMLHSRSCSVCSLQSMFSSACAGMICAHSGAVSQSAAPSGA